MAQAGTVKQAQYERLPDFFIVGHFKCGTSALYEMLRRHPQIYMPDFKETWYFAPELRSPAKQRRKASRPETREEYLSLFQGAGHEQRWGDNSPAYLMSRTAASRIAEAQPEARIIAILREPAEFLRSFHLHCVRNHVESEQDLQKALALEDARREGREIPPNSLRPHELLYSEHVRYVEQLRRYREVFPSDRMMVLIYEDFRRDNVATVRDVLRFLQVDESAPIEVLETNQSVRVRSQRLHDFLRSVYIGQGPIPRTIKSGVKAISTRRVRHSALRTTLNRVVYADPQAADEEFMRELRRRFKGEVQAISEYLDRDLVSLWGYDSVG